MTLTVNALERENRDLLDKYTRLNRLHSSAVEDHLLKIKQKDVYCDELLNKFKNRYLEKVKESEVLSEQINKLRYSNDSNFVLRGDFSKLKTEKRNLELLLVRQEKKVSDLEAKLNSLSIMLKVKNEELANTQNNYDRFVKIIESQKSELKLLRKMDVKESSSRVRYVEIYKENDNLNRIIDNMRGDLDSERVKRKDENN